MRTNFINQLIEEARRNEKIFLLVGDLGYHVIEPFAEEFPDRFLNVGIAEQNMAGIAAGLAMTGYNVYFYSIGNFPTIRCLEQIRNDIAYHQANVKVVSVGAGYAYGSLGATHQQPKKSVHYESCLIWLSQLLEILLKQELLQKYLLHMMVQCIYV